MISEGMRYYIHAEVFKTVKDAETLNQVVTKVCDLIEEQSQKMESGWVRCDERLPTADDRDWMGEVVWYLPGGHIEFLRDTWCDPVMKRRATHWKPTMAERPQPPEDLK